MISASVIADSISPQGVRITSMQLRYPKFIHGEFLTHRLFSRSSSSSRAIPVERIIKDVRNEPAMPVHWGVNQSGMQAEQEFPPKQQHALRDIWLSGMRQAVAHAESLMQAGVHKQIANRIMEPYLHINTLVTATEFGNFYELRRHKDAQPEIHALANCMFAAQEDSEPKLLRPSEWHLPYVRTDTIAQVEAVTDDKDLVKEMLLKISTARCARVSYKTVEGETPDIEKDLQLYGRLMGSVPLHASPAEHQATPDTADTVSTLVGSSVWHNKEEHGNFRGWIQHRKLVELGVTP